MRPEQCHGLDRRYVTPLSSVRPRGAQRYAALPELCNHFIAKDASARHSKGEPSVRRALQQLQARGTAHPPACINAPATADERHIMSLPSGFEQRSEELP